MKIIILMVIIVVAFVWYVTKLNQSTSGSIYAETVEPDNNKVEEAKFFLKNYLNPKIDGSNDGILRERQWCS